MRTKNTTSSKEAGLKRPEPYPSANSPNMERTANVSDSTPGGGACQMIKMYAAATIVYGTAALVMLFILGLKTDNYLTMVLSIMATGAAYLSMAFLVATTDEDGLTTPSGLQWNFVLMMISIALGLLALIANVWR